MPVMVSAGRKAHWPAPPSAEPFTSVMETVPVEPAPEKVWEETVNAIFPSVRSSVLVAQGDDGGMVSASIFLPQPARTNAPAEAVVMAGAVWLVPSTTSTALLDIGSSWG